MEGEPKPPVLVRVTQCVFLFFAFINAWSWLASAAVRRLDDDMLTGRLTFLSVILFVMSAFLIGDQMRYARALAISSCLLMIFRAFRTILFFDPDPSYFFPGFNRYVILWLPQIVLFLSIAAYFAFSPKVIHYYHPGREPKFTDPPPPPSFDA